MFVYCTASPLIKPWARLDGGGQWSAVLAGVGKIFFSTEQEGYLAAKQSASVSPCLQVLYVSLVSIPT